MQSAHLSRRFWLEAVLAATASTMFFLTLLWPDWAEVVFRIDPDGGSGAFEVAVTVALGAAAFVLIASATSELRGLRARRRSESRTRV